LSPEQRRKDNARSYANVYLKRGKIVRGPCERCGGSPAEMHHDDYGRPLDVRWLCRRCHLDEHSIEDESESAPVEAPAE
jgi:ribosomal protein S27AE